MCRAHVEVYTLYTVDINKVEIGPFVKQGL